MSSRITEDRSKSRSPDSGKSSAASPRRARRSSIGHASTASAGSSVVTSEDRRGATTGGRVRNRSADADDSIVSSLVSSRFRDLDELTALSSDNLPRSSHRSRRNPDVGGNDTFSKTKAEETTIDAGAFDTAGFVGDSFSKIQLLPATQMTTAFPSGDFLAASQTGDFDTAFATDQQFENATFGAADFKTGFHAFGESSATDSKSAKAWDTSPHINVPVIEPKKLTLKQRIILNKNFKCPPISNPANGNIIFVSSTAKGVYLHEVDPSRNSVQVQCVSVISPGIREKTATKYNATITAVDRVWTLAAGLHTSSGQRRTHVAAILDLRLLEAATSLRVVAVWQWNGGVAGGAQLQYVMTPPGGDFVYDVSMLKVADGLFFLAGSSPKGACVFISKPAVREAWSANYLTGSGAVSAMAVSPTHPYLVIALTDQSVIVWTYKSALDKMAASEKTSKRLLFPLCRLDHATALTASEREYPGNEDEAPSGPDNNDVGRCTSLVWLPPHPTRMSLVLLAVAFENGFVVFHVNLPVISSNDGYEVIPEPTPTTVASATPLLSPIAVKWWRGQHNSSFISWVNLGAHVDPCLGILLHDANGRFVRVILCSLHFAIYIKGQSSDESFLTCNVVASATSLQGSSSYLTGLLQSHETKAIACFSKQNVSLMCITSSNNAELAPMVASLGHAVSSLAPGLTSDGNPLLLDAKDDKDGILHIYSSIVCERTINILKTSMLSWTLPKRRYWLCKTVVGDTKETYVEETKEDKGFGLTVETTGGAVSDVVCGLNHEALVGLVPFRIVRCLGSTVCAILFRPSLGTHKKFTLTATKIALVDCGNALVEVVEGRDVAFLPVTSIGAVQGLVLNIDGSALTFFSWSAAANSFKFATSFRPLLAVECDENYITCLRISVFMEDGKLTLAVFGKRLRDERAIFAVGEVCDVSDASAKDWSKLLPNIDSGRIAFLGLNEEVFSMIGLQGDGRGYRNFALSTSSRVIVLSSALTIEAAFTSDASCERLAPLGSFAVCFSSQNVTRYLCCLDDELVQGVIALPLRTKLSVHRSFLMAVRPDRLLYCSCQSGVSLIEFGQNLDAFMLSTVSTQPAFLLEPMVANAVCIGGKGSQSTTSLRGVVEKFGRDTTSISHGENEGIGRFGSGLTSKTFAIFNRYGLKEAASWLLTGTVKFDRTANSTILPSWLPISSKAKGALRSKEFMHLVANGDSYLSEYIKSPDQNSASHLPRQSDSTAYICVERAMEELARGKPADMLEIADIAGTEASESLILQLSLILEKGHRHNVTTLLKSLSGFDDNVLSRAPGLAKPTASLAALAVALKKNQSVTSRQVMNSDQHDQWLKPLAPAYQRSLRLDRGRQRLFGVKELENFGSEEIHSDDKFWSAPCNESKHVWNEGPRKEKETLLVLDSIKDWLGCKRPLIIGKEGASAANDRGDKTLADILNQDDDSFAGKDESLESVGGDDWVDGIGEGRSDEANLSGYFRFSEGEDNKDLWKTEGFIDISPYQNKAFVVGDSSAFLLEQSTSSVDEGEPGKVKALFDLVFNASSEGKASGLALPTPRGGSLDIGILHKSDWQSRQKCSIEFWYFLPSSDKMSNEVILARRSFGPHGDDLSQVTIAANRDCVLWELVLLKSGELEFRTCGGSILVSSQIRLQGNGPEENGERFYLAAFGRWNHVCLVFSSRDLGKAECSVTVFMKGVEVVSARTSMLPSKMSQSDLDDDSKCDDILRKAHMLFGLNHCLGFRMTELRVWACERGADDIQSLLYEYLTAAEQKKKFKVKIANKKKGSTIGKVGLAPPKLGVTKSGMFPPSRTFSSMTPLLSGPAFSLAPPPKVVSHSDENESRKMSENQLISKSEVPLTPTTLIASHREKDPSIVVRETSLVDDDEPQTSNSAQQGIDNEGHDVAATLWDSATPLSGLIRSSAAAALIRGPPATRHYGGNRGGLPDFSGVERYGVGGIAICGSEKTIVFRDNEDPPALTYPIGASGAVVSDQMDDDGSEFLCCFLAREGRMVVFELRSRTVVVELQMTTKLNFWRYLPPEAAENTLCFMLITPVGGFHWHPLDESPRPHQVWKRGPELQGKKVVCYEEGGSNGLDGSEILSRVGLVMATKSSGGKLEGWLVPISGDSHAQQVSDDMQGACLCEPLYVDEGPFLPLLVTVHGMEGDTWVNVLSIAEPEEGNMALGDVLATHMIEEVDTGEITYDPPAMAMGTQPDALCVSLSHIIVVVLRRKGIVAAFELDEGELNLIAQENVGHFVIDAVMRYSAEIGGAEIVMLLSDGQNPKDGRIVSFCFRSSV